jgi:DNA-directed RNA polymerase sigma subunit (sigma70/sigma32)
LGDRIPVHMNESMNKLLRASRELDKELGRTPTNEEIGRRMDIPVMIPEMLRGLFLKIILHRQLADLALQLGDATGVV